MEAAGLSLAGARGDGERGEGIASRHPTPALRVRGHGPVPTAPGTRRAVALSLEHRARARPVRRMSSPRQLLVGAAGTASAAGAVLAPRPLLSPSSVAASLARSLPRTQFNGRKALQRVRGVGNVYCLASETLESSTGKAQSQSCPGCSAKADLQLQGSGQRGRGKATACKRTAKKTLPVTA